MTHFTRTLVLAMLLCTPFPTLAQITITQKHSNGLYGADEDVVFTITPAANSHSTEATYSLLKNGVRPPVQQGTLDFSSGSATVDWHAEEPSQVTIEVIPQTPATLPSTAPANEITPPRRVFGGLGGPPRDGAIIDDTHLKPALSRPDDFDDWWSKKLAELDAIPTNAKLEKVEINSPAIEYDKVTLDNINGSHVRGQLAKPAKEGKFPALLQFQYAGVYPLQRAWVTDRAKAGWLALNVEAHDMPIDDKEKIAELAKGDLRDYQAIGNTDREKSYFLRMYLGDCRALEYLTSRPDWDGKTLVVMGESMGGQQSFATVGLVGEKLHVTAMICHVPAGGDVGSRSAGRSVAYPNWPNNPEVIHTAQYFDIANFAPRIKVPSLVSFGLFDTIAPPTSALAAFNLINAPKELLPLHSDHGGPGQRPHDIRREEWLSALVKGEPAPVSPAN